MKPHGKNDTFEIEKVGPCRLKLRKRTAESPYDGATGGALAYLSLHIPIWSHVGED